MIAPRAVPAGSSHVATLLSRGIALLHAAAWLSLGSQVSLLVGSHGLLPVRDFVDSLPEGLRFAYAPTFLRWDPSDGALALGVATGTVAACAAFAGVFPRALLALSTFLYLGYAVACRSFLGFQWDNLLLECGALAVLLPEGRRCPWVLFLFKVLLFKLYFESGVAKWQSHLGDWKDGSAMAFYYETAPLPTRLAWYAHHLPAWWHALESRGTLVLELGLPFLVFGPRKARLLACGAFTAFQAINLATANYGFFSHLAIVLHAVLLDEDDADRLLRAPRRLGARVANQPGLLRLRTSFRFHVWSATSRLRERFRPRAAKPASRNTETLRFVWRLGVAAVVTTTYLAVSFEDALEAFSGGGERTDGALAAFAAAFEPFRVINTYHLFGHITRDRVEPTFETASGDLWTAHDLRYKPGDPSRPPPFVAPHQPRVDFLLWFYGLSYQRGTPEYVRAVLTKLCTAPHDVKDLFPDALPAHPDAARVAFYRYHFTTAAERRATGAYFTRELLPSPRTLRCTP